MEIDYVIKLGGSLLYDIEKTRLLLQRSKDSQFHNVYLIGSGYLGEVFKKWKNMNNILLSFQNSAKCWANIQSINACIINGLDSDFLPCSTIDEIYQIISEKKQPIIDTRDFYKYFSTSPNQKSNVRATLACKMLQCKKLIIFTDVNGVYSEDPKNNIKATKFKEIQAKELISMVRANLDEGFAENLINYGITAYIIGINEFLSSSSFVDALALESTIIHP